jgi:hypothetical protein
LLGLASVALVPLSCGGSEPAPQSPASPGTSASASPNAEAPSVAWNDMNHAQRLDYMKKVVFPKMKDEFASFDAKHYGDMNCKSCHGKGTDDGSFKMPNADLPKLPSTPDGFKKRAQEKPEIFQFMMTKVVPDTAALLGEKPYDMKTNEGFGCFECHTKEP